MDHIQIILFTFGCGVSELLQSAFGKLVYGVPLDLVDGSSHVQDQGSRGQSQLCSLSSSDTGAGARLDTRCIRNNFKMGATLLQWPTIVRSFVRHRYCKLHAFRVFLEPWRVLR